MQCQHPITLKNGDDVPCGKCPQCLANNRQEWVFRLRVEQYNSELGLFVTLTYADDQLPPDGVSKRDCQLFIKRLRKHFPPGDLRYYLVSEYGSKSTKRAHYHGLFFFTTRYDKRFVYDAFEQAWPKGFLYFGDVEEGSIVYCTKYCLKKTKVPKGQNENFRLLSKMKGGIGYQYIKENLSLHDEQHLDVAYLHGKRCRMPKYYKDKYKDRIFGDHRMLWPRYAAYMSDRRIESAERQVNDFESQFRLWLSDRRRVYKDFHEALAAFCNEYRERKVRQGELILKHTKQQNEF